MQDLATALVIDLKEQRVRLARARCDLRRVSGGLKRLGARSDLLLHVIPSPQQRVEERRAGAAKLRQKSVDEYEFLLDDAGEKLGERLAERDARTQPPRPRQIQKSQKLIDQHLRNLFSPDDQLGLGRARGAEVDEIDLPLRIARGERNLSHFVEIVIFGGQPEKDGGGDSAGLVLTLQL